MGVRERERGQKMLAELKRSRQKARSSHILNSGESDSSKSSSGGSSGYHSVGDSDAHRGQGRFDLPAIRKAASVDCLLVKRDPFRSSRDLREFRTPITGSSLLHVASYYGKVGLVKELVNVHGMSLDEKNHANWSGRHYLERFDQPLNCKLNLAVRPNRAKGASTRFRFKYLAGKEEDK